MNNNNSNPKGQREKVLLPKNRAGVQDMSEGEKKRYHHYI